MQWQIIDKRQRNWNSGWCVSHVWRSMELPFLVAVPVMSNNTGVNNFVLLLLPNIFVGLSISYLLFYFYTFFDNTGPNTASKGAWSFRRSIVPIHAASALWRTPTLSKFLAFCILLDARNMSFITSGVDACSSQQALNKTTGGDIIERSECTELICQSMRLFGCERRMWIQNNTMPHCINTQQIYFLFQMCTAVHMPLGRISVCQSMIGY